MHLVSKSGSYRNGVVFPPACREASPVHAPAPAVSTFPSSVGGLSRTVSVEDRYRRRQTIGLGIVQATIGALCIVFNAVSLGFHDTLILQRTSVSFVGHGFWIGMLVWNITNRITLHITRLRDNIEQGQSQEKIRGGEVDFGVSLSLGLQSPLSSSVSVSLFLCLSDSLSLRVCFCLCRSLSVFLSISVCLWHPFSLSDLS